MAESAPKRKKGSWDPLQMQAALKAVNSGRKIKEVARSFMLPESSIRDRLKKGEYYDPRLGRKSTFSKEDEKELADHIIKLAKTFFGISQQQLRKLAYDFAISKNVKHIFSAEKGMAGKCWVYAFLKRNPGISLRLPEPTSMNRVLGFNKTEIALFFRNLEEMAEKNAYPAERIFNVDEAGISTVQRPGKIYAPKGVKQVGKITSGERGQNVTVVCAMNASGTSFIPPMFIYPRQRIKPSLKIGGPIGAEYECSKSGWITEELFEKWLRHFAKNIIATTANPTLLILDNHASHLSLKSYQFCRENGIHMLSLPPHTSHRMQPLDVTFYGPLKKAYNRECDLYMKSNPYEKITHDVLASIFNKAYLRVASMDKAVKGFEVTGIHPINPHVFDNDDFISDPIIEDSTTRNKNSFNNDIETEALTTHVTNETEPVASTSCSNILNVLSPVPQKIQKIKRRSKKQHSQNLTATPLKVQLEDKERKKRSKEEKKGKGKRLKVKTLTKGKSVKRKLLISSSEESSDDIPLAQLCDDDDEDEIGSEKENENTDDVCKLCGEFGRNKEVWFRCCACSSWIHKECSGKDTAQNYICDFC